MSGYSSLQMGFVGNVGGFTVNTEIHVKHSIHKKWCIIHWHFYLGFIVSVYPD